MQKIAFFDIDGTLFRSSLVIELVTQLTKEGVFPQNTPDMFRDEYEAWLDREGSYEDYIHAVVRTFMTNIKGVFYGDLADIGREVIRMQGRHIYRYTRDLIRDLRQKNYFLVAISQSPKTIVDDFCTSYGFHKSYGRLYELGPQDLFTGEMIDVHLIQNKANIVKRVLENNENVTLDGSIGVGDTDGDITLLEAVEIPICFNPNKKLFDYASQMGWKIVLERKDVIYEL